MLKPMTQRELIAALSEESGVEKKDVNVVLAALTKVVSAEIAKGGTVTLPGLVKIRCADRPARMVRNPSTGEKIHKEADRRVSALVLKGLKEIAQKDPA